MTMRPRRFGDDAEGAPEIGGSRQVLLFDGDRMSQAAGGVAEFDDAEPAVSVVHAQERNPVFRDRYKCVLPACTLDPIVLDGG